MLVAYGRVARPSRCLSSALKQTSIELVCTKRLTPRDDAGANQVIDAFYIRVVRGLAIGLRGCFSAEQRKVGSGVKHSIDAFAHFHHAVGVFDFACAQSRGSDARASRGVFRMTARTAVAFVEEALRPRWLPRKPAAPVTRQVPRSSSGGVSDTMRPSQARVHRESNPRPCRLAPR